MDGGEILAVGAIYAFAGFVRGFAGFGFAVVAVPAISLVVAPEWAIVTNALVGVMLGVYSVYLHREHSDYVRVMPMIAVSLAFIPLGAAFLYSVSTRILMVSLGGTVIGLTILGMTSGTRLNRVLSHRLVGLAFCSLGGFLSGAYTAGGPAIVAYLYNSDISRARAKANLQLFLLLVAGAVVVTHVAAGRVSVAQVPYAFVFAPLAAVAARGGFLLARHIPARTFRMATDVGLIALGSYIVLLNL